MGDTATVTVRLSGRTKDRLGELAGHTRRTRSFLAAEAIDAYVERELAIVEGIERAREDVLGGRLVRTRKWCVTRRRSWRRHGRDVDAAGCLGAVRARRLSGSHPLHRS